MQLILVVCLFMTCYFQAIAQSEIKIADQVWMSKNLDVMYFRNGEKIPQAKSQKAWQNLTQKGKPAWCYFNFDSKLGKKYGKLYNVFCVFDSRGLAPEGWRIPSQSDWNTLSTNLGGYQFAGKKLKSIVSWINGEFSNNESGFDALPGGYCHPMGYFQDVLGKYGNWWSSTLANRYETYSMQLHHNNTNFYIEKQDNRNGFSVRCIKE